MISFFPGLPSLSSSLVLPDFLLCVASAFASLHYEREEEKRYRGTSEGEDAEKGTGTPTRPRSSSVLSVCGAVAELERRKEREKKPR